MRHSTEPFAQHYSEWEHPVRGSVGTKLHSRQGRKEEPSVTAPVTVMPGRRAQPRLRLPANTGSGAARPALPRWCFRHTDGAAARTGTQPRSRQPATAQSRSLRAAATSATPLRLQPRHQPGGGGGKRGREAPLASAAREPPAPPGPV